jgi:NitT/TauT family transport system substrate-binding protein
MNTSKVVEPGRRVFLAQASAVGGAAVLGLNHSVRAEPPLETKKIRVMTDPTICLAPQLISEDLLRLEGFSEIEYVSAPDDPTLGDSVAAGKGDITADTAASLILLIDAGQPLVLLSGVHAGCFVLFGNKQIHAIRDLKGKRLGIYANRSEDHLQLSTMLAYVGIDPIKEVHWVAIPSFEDEAKAFVDGKIDAFLAFPPHPQRLRAQKIEHVIVDTTRDAPWSHYFCCMFAANRDFARAHPIATKRALRALLKATDICSQEPERAAQYLVARGHEPSYDVALQVLKEVNYTPWRQFNPEDTLRFYGLRLHDIGIIKSTPQKLIAQGTDWRFLNELKKELKA